MRKIILTLLFILGLLGGFVFYIFSSTGYFREVEASNLFGPVFQTIALPGVEDMALARADSLLILSVDDRAAIREGKTGMVGIYMIDLRKTPFEPILLTGQLDFPFFPHGLSIFQLDSAKYSLMAINHSDGKHSIEHFILNGKTLTHQKSITDPNFVSPNDLVMVGPEKFYYSNDHGYTGGLGVFAENYLGLKASNVGYYDGTSAEIKAGSIGYANGMQYDSEEKLLYVAAVRSFLVKVYKVENDWNLTHLEDIKTGTGVDNIELDESGTLWIGAHPNLLQFASYAAGKNPTAPSEVIQINYSADNSTVKSIYTDSGTTISGSSVALPWGDYLFIGNVMDSKMLVLKREY
jgi:arylesterase/paraoxonase